MTDVLTSCPAHAKVSAAADQGAVSIAPLAPTARFSLRLPPAAAAEIRNAAGFPLDLPVNRSRAADGLCSLRLGPDEWLLLGPEDASDALESKLSAALESAFHSLVDIGHRHCAFAVAGAHAREVINGGCALDLDDVAFPAGTVVRTLFGKAEIILERQAGEAAYRIECLRSFGPYVLGLLEDVALGFKGG